MYLISAKGYKNAEVQFLRVQETGEIWGSMKDTGGGMGVKNISNLVLKEIHGILKKNPTKEQINEDKMTEREIYEKFDKLSEEELNAKSNKKVYIKNVTRTNITKHCRGGKKRGVRAIDGFTKKLMVPDYEIPKYAEFEVKSKLGRLFMNQNFFEEYSVRVYEIDPFFYEHHKEKIKVDRNDHKYILLRNDAYSTEYCLAVEIDKQNDGGRELIFK